MGEFAKKADAKFDAGLVRFDWGEGEDKRTYEISAEALVQAFGARDDSGSELLDAFERGRVRIIAAAEDARNTPLVDGVIELGSGDFDEDDPGKEMSPP
ncbi:DUF1488 family protein [Pusillimonas sp. TS35]|uniref:DUF1488 family protein n=1 Tax=Paracandidimonas lactea TaxID=2895524 RepID=UPI0013688209|nr:DUF1488 family protein [Paracandidimonas lactea]MYN11575.1 DUF1488 family protein [Pusillimonas sp. TS35]